MRWLADECVDGSAAAQLRADGHDVLYIAEMARAASDAEVLSLAERENRILLTEDKDFGAFAFRQATKVHGVVLLRIGSSMSRLKQQRLSLLVERYGETLIGRYTIVDEHRFRSRPLLRSSS